MIAIFLIFEAGQSSFETKLIAKSNTQLSLFSDSSSVKSKSTINDAGGVKDAYNLKSVEVKNDSAIVLDFTTHDKTSDSDLYRQCEYILKSSFLTPSDFKQMLIDKINFNWLEHSDSIFLSQPIDDLDIASRFYLALDLAGLLEPVKIKNKLNPKAALEILNGIIIEDPQNSASYLFAALILDQHAQPQLSQKFLKRADQTTHFDSYSTQIARSLYRNANNPYELLLAQSIYSSFPVPDMIALKDFLQKNETTFFAEQMLVKGLDERNVLADVEWSALDYAIGRFILLRQRPEAIIPSLKEVLLKKSMQDKANDEFARSILKGVCDPVSLTSEFDWIKSRL